MEFLREASRALRDNLRPVALYVLVSVALGAVQVAAAESFLRPSDGGGDTAAAAPGIYWVALLIALAAIGAAADSVLFARIGREVDKPMWRVSNDADALTLFYGLWLLLRLIILAYDQLVQLVATDTSEPVTIHMFLLSYFVLFALLTAFGACVMFYGRVRSEEVSQAFSTLSHHAGPIALICLVGIFAGFTLLYLAASIPVAAFPLVSALDGLVTCYIFTFTWLVCMFHRDHYEHHEDDLDF